MPPDIKPIILAAKFYTYLITFRMVVRQHIWGKVVFSMLASSSVHF